MSSTRYQVFASITPGFEASLAEEVQLLELCDRPNQVQGGIECRLSREELWRFALESRLAESLRVRIGRFRAPSFQALETGARKLPWAAYLPRGALPSVKVTCKRSALYHSTAVAQRISRVVTERLGSTECDPSDDSPSIFVRLNRDMATLSVDATGERLHKRGYRGHVGKAPLRETLAAAILWVGGLKGQSIWDPFCGSGTILLEAVAFAVQRKNLGRHFAFERWPSHPETQWERFLAALGPPEATTIQTFGSDIDAKEIRAAENNVKTAGFETKMSLINDDFEAAAEHVPEGVAICTNFPYGHRVGAKSSLRPLGRRFGRILRRRTDISDAVVLCGHRSFERDTGCDWELLLGFRNRGLPVRLLRLRQNK